MPSDRSAKYIFITIDRSDGAITAVGFSARGEEVRRNLESAHRSNVEFYLIPPNIPSATYLRRFQTALETNDAAPFEQLTGRLVTLRKKPPLLRGRRPPGALPPSKSGIPAPPRFSAPSPVVKACRLTVVTPRSRLTRRPAVFTDKHAPGDKNGFVQFLLGAGTWQIIRV